MPTKARRLCTRCGTPVSGSRCTKCAARKRDTNNGWRYNDTEWKTSRLAYLLEYPVCCLCGEPSFIPDHHPTSRRDLIAQGVTDPDAWHRLRPLCETCHRRETAKNQPGGFMLNRD